MTTPQAQPATTTEPLWTDNDILTLTARVGSTNWLLMIELRDVIFAKRRAYEAALGNYHNYQGAYLYYVDQAEKDADALATAAQRIRELEAELADEIIEVIGMREMYGYEDNDEAKARYQELTGREYGEVGDDDE